MDFRPLSITHSLKAMFPLTSFLVAHISYILYMIYMRLICTSCFEMLRFSETVHNMRTIGRKSNRKTTDSERFDKKRVGNFGARRLLRKFVFDLGRKEISYRGTFGFCSEIRYLSIIVGSDQDDIESFFL